MIVIICLTSVIERTTKEGVENIWEKHSSASVAENSTEGGEGPFTSGTIKSKGALIGFVSCLLDRGGKRFERLKSIQGGEMRELFVNSKDRTLSGKKRRPSKRLTKWVGA